MTLDNTAPARVAYPFGKMPVGAPPRLAGAAWETECLKETNTRFSGFLNPRPSARHRFLSGCQDNSPSIFGVDRDIACGLQHRRFRSNADYPHILLRTVREFAPSLTSWNLISNSYDARADSHAPRRPNTATRSVASRSMSSTSDADDFSTDGLTNLLALAEDEVTTARDVTTQVLPFDARVDDAHVAALAAIAERAAALPPYAGDDDETDAVFDELLRVHASIAGDEKWSEADDETRLDREAVERASGLVDAIAAISGSAESTAVAEHADAVRRRLAWSLEDIRARREEAVSVEKKVTAMRRVALRHTLETANGFEAFQRKSRGEDEAGVVETALEDAALDREAAMLEKLAESQMRQKLRALDAQVEGNAGIAPLHRGSRNDIVLQAKGLRSKMDDEAKSEEKRSPSRSDRSRASTSSLDEVIDRELRNQRLGRARTTERANEKVTTAVLDAGRKNEKRSAAAADDDEGDASHPVAASSSSPDSAVSKPESASKKNESRNRFRRRMLRDALVALPVLAFSMYDTARGERRRSESAARAARRRSEDSKTTRRLPGAPVIRKESSSTNRIPPHQNRSPYSIPSTTTMKVGANSYEVENGRVVTLATPREAREVRKAFAMG